MRFSAQATWSGKTAASRSSARMRWIGGGTLRAAAEAQNRRARAQAFQRQRAPNIGRGEQGLRQNILDRVGASGIRRPVSSGKACCSPSEMTMPLSVAAACSSKLKVRQKRLRRASPQARLMRAPKGAWRTSCMPPDSSKKRSATTVSWWAARRARRRRREYRRWPVGAGFVEPAFGRRLDRVFAAGAISLAQCRDCCDSSAERPGASPSQNGMRGRGAVRILHAHPAAAHAADAPGVRAQQEHVAGQAFDREVLVERADDFAFGLGDHGDSAAFSGIAPPEVMAARRAPRRPRTRPLTWSRCSSAPLRPREVAMPSESIVDDGVEIGARQIAVGIGACG